MIDGSDPIEREVDRKPLVCLDCGDTRQPHYEADCIRVLREKLFAIERRAREMGWSLRESKPEAHAR